MARKAPFLWLLVPAGALLSPPAAGQLFSDAERSRIVEYWAAPSRYSTSIPPENRAAPWQVRLTAEGSVWLLRYQQAIGAGKAPPTSDPTIFAGGIDSWKQWVQRKLASDRWLAQQEADRLNVCAGFA